MIGQTDTRYNVSFIYQSIMKDCILLELPQRTHKFHEIVNTYSEMAIVGNFAMVETTGPIKVKSGRVNRNVWPANSRQILEQHHSDLKSGPHLPEKA